MPNPPHDPVQPLNHRRSIRLPGYDYSLSGGYFITLCTHHRLPLFGTLQESEITLSPAGRILEEIWNSLPARYPQVLPGPMVIMPDHFHAIIILDPNEIANTSTSPEDPLTRRHMALPMIIGYLKMNTAKRINTLRGTPGSPVWHRDYYEHIIRSENDFAQIEGYILNNPLKLSGEIG